MPAPSVLMGAVAYDPKVVTIWEGFRAWLRGRGLDFDFVLYSHYERQVEDLVAGRIDAAWNSPLAWLRAERLAVANGTTVRALTMRDTDQDLTSVVVVRADSPVRQVTDLAGKVVAVGAVDSPQATLIPLGHLAAAGVEVDVRRFDVGVGLHGDHIGGERDAARALLAGEVDAACMIDANHLAFVQEGTLPPEGTRIVAQTAPLRPLQHDGPRAGVRRGPALRHAAARHVVRRRTGASAARPGGADGLEGRPHHRVRRPGRGGRRHRLLLP